MSAGVQGGRETLRHLADLGRANLGGANLSGANLERVNLERATVTDEQLAQAESPKGAIMPDGTKHD